MESPLGPPQSSQLCLRWFAAILVCYLVLPKCDTTNAPTSCTTSPGVEGQPASVTCQFPEDLAVNKHNFHITRYDFDGLRSLPEIVYECYRYQNEVYDQCGAAAGFELDGHISDTVTLKIPRVTQRHAGVYKCDYISDDYSHIGGCSLHVRGREISCIGATVHEGDPANVTCHYNSDLSVTYDSFYIAFYKPGDKHDHGILMCTWTEIEPSRTLCYERTGYTFDSKVTNIVTIHIPAAGPSHVGYYFCDTSPTRRGVARYVCTVTVIGPVEKSTHTADGEQSEDNNVLIIVGVVVSVTVMIIVVVVVVVMVIRWQRKRRRVQNALSTTTANLIETGELNHRDDGTDDRGMEETDQLMGGEPPQGGDGSNTGSPGSDICGARSVGMEETDQLMGGEPPQGGDGRNTGSPGSDICGARSVPEADLAGPFSEDVLDWLSRLCPVSRRLSNFEPPSSAAQPGSRDTRALTSTVRADHSRENE